jgi:hypothetical protein
MPGATLVYPCNLQQQPACAPHVTSVVGARHQAAAEAASHKQQQLCRHQRLRACLLRWLTIVLGLRWGPQGI